MQVSIAATTYSFFFPLTDIYLTGWKGTVSVVDKKGKWVRGTINWSRFEGEKIQSSRQAKFIQTKHYARVVQRIVSSKWIWKSFLTNCQSFKQSPLVHRLYLMMLVERTIQNGGVRGFHRFVAGSKSYKPPTKGRRRRLTNKLKMVQ